MAKGAIGCVVESALKEGEPAPRNADPTRELITISI
jgi:hypothetical protein